MEVSGQLQASSPLRVIFEIAELLNNEFQDKDKSGQGVIEGYIAV
jgi:hypothetical protein